jgi:glycosyltransferase involved in cell wall biosynthesis
LNEAPSSRNEAASPGEDRFGSESAVRAVIFAHSLRGRGTERTLVRLLQHFDRGSVSPTLVLARAEGEFMGSLPSDVPLYDLKIRDRTSAALPRLSRIIRTLSPDVMVGIHTSPSRLLGLLSLVMRDPPPLLIYETDPFSRVEGEKGSLLIRRMISALTHRRARRIIAASEVVAGDLRTQLWLRDERIVVVPNPCVDPSLYVDARQPVDEPPYTERDAPVIITIGNMYAHKRQDVLLEAFSQVRERMKAHLVILGEGPLRAELQDRADRLGVGGSVWFKGFQRNPFKFLAASDVYVSAAESEGFDISQVEAMACGIPVIVTDAPRFRAVEHGKTGVLVPPNDAPALAGAICEVLTSSTLSGRLVEAAGDVVSNLSSERIARRWERVIQEVANAG